MAVNCVGIVLRKHWNCKSVAIGIYNISDYNMEETIGRFGLASSNLRKI
jgi:hypothetical protein